MVLSYLASAQLNEDEWEILRVLEYCSPVARGMLLDEATTVWGMRSRKAAAAALQSCVTRGLIKRLSRGDCLADQRRWANEDNEAVSDRPYRVGDLDLTVLGGSIWKRIASAIARDQGRPLGADTFYCHMEDNGDYSVFGVTEEDVLGGLLVNRDDDSPVIVRGPYAIGPWWINRHVQLPRGFRADARRSRQTNGGVEGMT